MRWTLDAADVLSLASAATSAAIVASQTARNHHHSSLTMQQTAVDRRSIVVSRTINLPLSDKMFVRSPGPTACAAAEAAVDDDAPRPLRQYKRPCSASIASQQPSMWRRQRRVHQDQRFVYV